jgi:hypothetical protein
MNTKTIIINIGTNDPLIVPKSVNHRCTMPKIKESTKELEVMDIDWSKAPEGATHYAEESVDNFACWIKQDHGLSYVAAWLHEKRGKDAVVHWNSPGDFILTDCVAKPQPPVYTQEMKDNTELPPIGSKVQFVGNDDYLVEFSIVDGDEIECICHTTDFEGESTGVYRHKDGYSVSILTQLVEPLTPPKTDKENAIDAAIGNLMFYGDQTQTEQKANETLIAIMEGKIHGVTWSAE